MNSNSTSRSPAVRRLMKEFMDLQNDPSNEFIASPLSDNIFEWHFTIRGPAEGGFQGGRYHGRIVFTTDYPFKPPSIYFLTPNGRFETGKKICLSITGFHPEFWRPAWGVRSALIALISFMTTPGDGAIGALDYTEEERKVLAQQSINWKCSVCESNNATCLPDESERPVQKLECESELTFSMDNPSSRNSNMNLSINENPEKNIDPATKDEKDTGNSTTDIQINGIDMPRDSVSTLTPSTQSRNEQLKSSPPFSSSNETRANNSKDNPEENQDSSNSIKAMDSEKNPVSSLSSIHSSSPDNINNNHNVNHNHTINHETTTSSSTDTDMIDNIRQRKRVPIIRTVPISSSTNKSARHSNSSPADISHKVLKIVISILIILILRRIIIFLNMIFS